jgi:hypothetical protein
MLTFHQFNEDIREPTGPWVVLKKGCRYWKVGNYPTPGEIQTVETDTRVHCYQGERPAENGMNTLGVMKGDNIQFAMQDTK